jgi:YVTN family beta-propeller protein
MQKTFVALVTLLCASASLAQFVEEVIDLPDSSGPIAVCYAPTVQKVYCCNELSDSVTIINAVSNHIIKSITTRKRPFAMCFNPTRNKLYVANLEDSSVSVIDPTSDSILATVNVGGGPWELYYNAPLDKIYSANYTGGSVSAINGATNALIFTIPYVSSRFLCGSPDGQKVFTARIGMGHVIDCRFDLKVDSFPAGNYVHDIMYVPTSKRVYITEYDGHEVWIVDGVADTFVKAVTLGNGTEGLCYNQRDDKVYCSVWGDGRVMVLDGAGDSLIAAVNVGTVPWSMLYDSLHNKVYCANQGDSVVHVISGSADTVVATCTTGVGPVALAWAPDLNKVFVANYQGSSVAVIRDSTPAGIEDPEHVSPGRTTQVPTLLLGPTPAVLDGATLHDITGRKTAVLRQDVDYSALLRPGVYLARTADGSAAKVLILR